MLFIQQLIRLNKYISGAGVCSRKEADKLILSGKIKVNGKLITTLGTKVNPNDEILYNGKQLSIKRFSYYVLNKPKEQKAEIILNAFATNINLSPIYDMEMSNSGLMFFTDDDHLINKIASKSNPFKQQCIIEFKKSVDENLMEKLSIGIPYKGKTFKVYSLQSVNHNQENNTIKISMSFYSDADIIACFNDLGYEVKLLDRIAAFGIKKGPLRRGKCRLLSEKEIGFLKMLKV